MRGNPMQGTYVVKVGQRVVKRDLSFPDAIREQSDQFERHGATAVTIARVGK